MSWNTGGIFLAFEVFRMASTRPAFALLVFVAPLVVPLSQASAQVEEQKIASEKSYYSYRPAEIAPKPLLIVDLYHGTGGAAQGIEQWKKIQSLHHVVIAPKYEGGDWKVYEDMNGGTAEGKKNEIKYILECVDDAQKRFKIDKKRIVLTGSSSGADYAFEIGLTNPDKFCGVVPMCPGWCGKPSKFDESAKRVRVYFLVGGTDPRKKQTIEAYENLRKATSDVVWRMHPSLGHERFPPEEIERAFRWQEEMLAEPSDQTLKYATEQVSTDVPQAGIHLLNYVANNSRKKALVTKAKELLQKIEKQAQKELAETKKLCDKKDEHAQESVWRLYDRYGALSLWDDVHKLLTN
ncbi:MAG TPA: hypothetical protein VFF73_34035 [Planctomycetota bacterium]|nr:hypothetical protein [Planctomycetota bacterium]